ncbi:MAG: PQQ-like beta-propeller repeat protein, partial [Planctomycetes bacterium]|nr:PQQ-like beta-propeller repeat protein [Planctomycetota bacterium]
ADPRDWPAWRGPQQNGVSTETGLIDKWNPRGGPGSNVLWKRADLGTISTPIVMGDKLYVLCRSDPGTRSEGERVVCVDAATGKDIWQHRFNVYLSDVPDTRVAWSSLVGDPATGRIYAQGVCGYFACLDGATGKPLWTRSMSEEFGLLTTYGGRTNVPVMFEDLVIISGVIIGWGDMAKPAHRFIALDKNTGAVVWFNGTRPLPEDTTYSTPVVSVIGGQAALVFGSGDGGIWAFQPRTGVPIWKYQASKRGINTSPMVVGDRVYVGHSEENINDTTMGNFLAINGAASGKPMPTGGTDITDSGAVWEIRECNVGKSSPVPIGDRIVAVDDRAKLFVYDAASGKEVARKSLGTSMRSSPLVADGKIYCCTTDGRWYTLRLDGDKVVVLQTLRLPSGDESQGSPICSHGRIFVPTTGALYCLEDKNKKPGYAPLPVPPAEDEKAGPIAHLQILPAEAMLTSGGKQRYQLRHFDAKGKEVRATTGSGATIVSKVIGAGKIDGDLYTAPSGTTHGAAEVEIAQGNLKGKARVRIVPPLPWKFDFSDGEVPITWIGCRYRHVIRDVDGNKLLAKVTTIPKGTRSQCWFGPIDLHDYTIQADMFGNQREKRVPDMGLIAQRYTVDLMGEAQQLQIRTWPPVLEQRMGKTIPFPWKPNTWYTIKMRVSNQGARAVVQAKVWPRGQAEPEKWTIEADDEAPNTIGSPGLYGNATNAEVFYDNVSVMKNE